MSKFPARTILNSIKELQYERYVATKFFFSELDSAAVQQTFTAAAAALQVANEVENITLKAS